MKTKTLGFLGVFAALALALAPYAARADLIYWMLDKPTYSAGKQTGDYVDFAFATISADGRTLDIYNSTTGGSDGQLLVPDVNTDGSYSSTPVYAGTFDSDSVSSFLVELWNSDGERMGWQVHPRRLFGTAS